LQKGRASGKLMDFAGDESFWNSIFFSYDNILKIWKTKKLYWKRSFLQLYWRRFFESLCKFFKFDLYCYNIPKIKNILIINIHLLFSTKTLLENVGNFSMFTSTSLPPPLNRL
jgi:hypothetical protein